MPVTIDCIECRGSFRIPDALFESRFAQRETAIKCKRCGSRIVIDGTRYAPVATSATSRRMPSVRAPAPTPTPALRVSVRPAAVPAPEAALSPPCSVEANEPVTIGADPMRQIALEAPSASSSSLRAVELPSAAVLPGVAESRPTLEADAAGSSEARSESIREPAARPRTPSFKRAAGAASLFLAAALGMAALGRSPRSAPPVEGPRAASRAVHHSEPPALPPAPISASPAFDSAVPALDSASPAPSTVAPAAYNEKALREVLTWAFTNAEDCHRGGRPGGAAVATLRFGPSGKVLHATLEGEPIASSSVSKCILSYLRSAMIPAYVGDEFTVTRTITLR